MSLSNLEGIRVCAGKSDQPGLWGKALICNICWLLWYKYTSLQIFIVLSNLTVIMARRGKCTYLKIVIYAEFFSGIFFRST